MCEVEEDTKGTVSLTDRWIVEVTGKVRRSPFASRGAGEEISTSMAIVSVAAEGGLRCVVAGAGTEGVGSGSGREEDQQVQVFL